MSEEALDTEGKVPVARLVNAYIKMRAKRADIKDAYEKEDATIAESMDVIKEALLKYCKDNGFNSVKTDAGTFFRSVRTKYWTSDWDSFEKRLHQVNLKTFLDENPDAVPKGLNADSYYSISIRSPKK